MYQWAFLGCTLPNIFFNEKFDIIRLQIIFVEMSCCKSAEGQDKN